MQKVQEIDYLVLTGLAEESAPLELGQLSQKIGLDQAKVSAVFVTRQGAELLVEEKPYFEISVGKKATVRASHSLFPRSQRSRVCPTKTWVAA